MNFRICRCCGEPMPETGNALSRNPNICASCSSMADGIEGSTGTEESHVGLGQERTISAVEVHDRTGSPEQAGQAAQTVSK
jgi:hypothetical protein